MVSGGVDMCTSTEQVEFCSVGVGSARPKWKSRATQCFGNMEALLVANGVEEGAGPPGRVLEGGLNDDAIESGGPLAEDRGMVAGVACGSLRHHPSPDPPPCHGSHGSGLACIDDPLVANDPWAKKDVRKSCDVGALSNNIGNKKGALPYAAPSAAKIIVLHGAFDPADSLHDHGFLEEIAADIEQECRKVANIDKVWADKTSVRGDVWLRCPDGGAAARIFTAMNRRSFDGRRLVAEYSTAESWDMRLRSP
jgi:hypothetical protein